MSQKQTPTLPDRPNAAFLGYTRVVFPDDSPVVAVFRDTEDECIVINPDIPQDTEVTLDVLPRYDEKKHRSLWERINAQKSRITDRSRAYRGDVSRRRRSASGVTRRGYRPTLSPREVAARYGDSQRSRSLRERQTNTKPMTQAEVQRLAAEALDDALGRDA